ncbi:UV excision repair protein RAD23 homolog B-like [Anopheles ziemanni]|uniref:UV excision repair protein RAD23 homolog B-like n=1 Tax=Anopheles coustani TaxID=139045 RepID=UPI0026586513|nr:UV excision repair protein RAD23 homolog B-like [Anopheles coustani]XP_058175516.1 UV excision repair protein RAD23 homolog B-like [Anopheles ziemanni]
MKITLKTLKQETFVVEVDMEKETVLALKEKLCVESGNAYPVERQRLIYLGKIMEDEQLLSQYNVDDKKFIVVMNKKPTPVASETAKAAAPGSTSASTSAKDSTPGKDVKTDEPSATAVAAASQSNPSTSSPAAAGTATEQQKPTDDTKRSESTGPAADDSADMQANIRRITEMGYSEQSARMALEICANYPDRAVEYLLSEMASGNDSEITLGAGMAGVVGGGGQGPQGPGDAVATAAAGTGGGRGSNNPLAFLRRHPVFQDMKRLLQEDPNMLPHLMQRIQSSNPDLMRIISNNQEEFLALINEPQQESQMSQELEDIAAAMVNSLTPSDMDAIDRLKALGYPEHLVIQAYIACERDEYNAAEFLVSQTLDDED